MRHHLIQLVLFIIKCSSALCQVEKIDSVLSDWNHPDVPGGVVAVVKNGEVLYKKAFGASDIQKRIPNSTSKPFELASVAKQFTAACIALLEEQGKLSREDDLKSYFPQFQFPGKISIKNLLDHTSGIREAYVLTLLSGKVNLKGQVPQRYQTKEYLLKVLVNEKDLNFKSGDEMVYTNVNYILLGDIIEKVSGMKLKHFADSAIFKPLKMHHTFFNDYESDSTTTGYYHTGKTFRQRHARGGIVGDHNLISTVDDLVIWSNNFYENQLGKKDSLFFHKLSTSSRLNNGEATGYGYGLFASTYKGHDLVHHGGDNGIHTSILLTIPAKKIAVVCLGNSSRYHDTERKAYEIADLFLADSLPTSKPAEHFSYVSLDQEQLSSRVGLYYLIASNNLGQLRKVTLEGSNLFISDHYSVKGLKLHAVSEHYFIARNPLNEYVHFYFPADSAAGYALREVYKDQADLKFSAYKPVRVQSSDYEGTYFHESTGARIKVSAGKGGIKARKGILRIPMTVFKEDVFYATQNNALFVFERNHLNQVTGLKINADDFRNFRLNKIK